MTIGTGELFMRRDKSAISVVIAKRRKTDTKMEWERDNSIPGTPDDDYYITTLKRHDPCTINIPTTSVCKGDVILENMDVVKDNELTQYLTDTMYSFGLMLDNLRGPRNFCEDVEKYDKQETNESLTRFIQATSMELELSEEMLERNDTIDNTVHDCLCVLAEKDLEWSMEMIADATESLKQVLKKSGFDVRHPGVVTNEDGTQHYSDYDEFENDGTKQIKNT